VTKEQRNTILIVLSQPRSGTTQLAAQLATHSNINFLGEIFHDGQGFMCTWGGTPDFARPIIQGVAKQLGASDPDAAPCALNCIRNDPAKTVNLLARTDFGRPQIFCFKIFPNHVSFAEYKRILRLSRCHVLSLVRSPIDCFISRSKARTIAAFKSVDTTDIKPSIEARAFVKFWSSRRRFMRANLRTTRELSVRNVLATYENLYTADAASAEKVASLLKSLNLEGGEHRPVRSLPRQDRSAGREDKVANWPEFVKQLEDCGDLAMLDDFELDPPMGGIEHKAVSLGQRLRKAARRFR